MEPHAPQLAPQTNQDAHGAALSTGQRDWLERASRALRELPALHPPRAAELLVTGQALMLTDGRSAGMPMLKQALSAFRSESLSGEDEMRGLLYACLVAIGLWDDESWHVLSARHVQLARTAGALTVLPLALEMHCASQVNAGEFAAAQALIDEIDAITAAAGSAPLNDAAVLLAGWRGIEAAALARIASAMEDAAERGEESTLTLAEYATAVLYNGLGRHDLALAAAQRSCEHHPAKAYARALIELVEGATRSGRPELAADAFEQLSEATTLSGTDWALGLEARTRALISEGEAAERCHREAIGRLARTRARVELARAQLLYGEWLRREQRPLDAREQLRAAYDLCLEAGMEAFAERAARELLASGETARRRAVETTDELTAQERQIARLARDGLPDPEIGARLLMSPQTVQFHLDRIFAKLDINSRDDLDRVLSRA
jgi:DNA-binding CsgD family transcriptional regulator